MGAGVSSFFGRQGLMSRSRRHVRIGIGEFAVGGLPGEDAIPSLYTVAVYFFFAALAMISAAGISNRSPRLGPPPLRISFMLPS